MSTIYVNTINPTGSTKVTVNGAEIKNWLGNTFIGGNINTNTSGGGNVSIGDYTMQSLTTGANNTSVGQNSLLSITTGGANTGIGNSALGSLTTGAFNTSLGVGSLVNCVSGFDNVAIGINSLLGCVSSLKNVAVGNQTGESATGSNNVFIGYYAGATQTFGNNNIYIGYNSSGSTSTVSNEITLGNSSNTVIRAAVTTITSLSDGRDKKDVEELPVGLSFIESLNPVKFVWNDRDENGKHDIKDFGFIAQDLKSAQENAGVDDILKLVYEENPDKLEASYGKLVPILVKAIQELSDKVKMLENK